MLLRTEVGVNSARSLAFARVGVALWLLAHPRIATRTWERVVDSQLLPHVLVGAGRGRRRWPVLLLGLAGLSAIVALAGPVWERLPQPVFRSQSALVIGLDLSRSMDAADLKPSRLARARFKINDILEHRQEGQTALVVYAAEAFTVAPLTDDTATIASQLPALNTDLMPAQGSRADRALELARKLITQAGLNSGQVILVTDGIEPERDVAAAEALAEAGIHTSVLGVGGAEGAPIPLTGGFLKDDSGSIVISRLGEAALKELAAAGGGRYRRLRVDDSDLAALVAQWEVGLDAEEVSDSGLRADTWREHGPWLVLFLLPLAALTFRRGYLAVVVASVFTVPQGAEAFDWSELWWRGDQRGARALEAGDAPKAAELFRDPAWKGAARYRAGEFEQALQSLEGLEGPESSYNRGTALARLGRYEEAIASYDETLRQNPEHEDARFNRELLLEQQQQQEQDQDQQQQQQSDQQAGGQPDPQQARDPDGQTGDREQQPAPGSGERREQQQQPTSASGEQEPRQEDQPQQDQQQPDQQRQGQARQEPGEASEADATPPVASSDELPDEEQQAMEQWLRKIPDDPGGLLRRKFYYQYQRQQRQATEDEPW